MPSRQETRSIADLFSDSAYRKSRAAAVRYISTNAGQESAREVYLASCAAIGKHLEESYGFKYAKSGPHVRRRCGEFTFEVGFQSSHNNVAGQHVMLIVDARVRSTKLKRWREANALQIIFDTVAGGQLGNLRPDFQWRTWELADPSNRYDVIRDAVEAIEEIAFPIFANFEDLPALCQSLVNKDLPGLSINGAVELLLCFADHTTARAAAANYLNRRPDFLRAYQRDFERYAERGLDSNHASGTKKLAWASHRFEFGDLSKGD